MRALIQRVTRGAVRVEEEIVGAIDAGLVILIGVGADDREDDADFLAQKVAGLRIFSDEAGRFNFSLIDIGGGALVVSQFTLYADARFAAGLRAAGVTVATGRFRSHMAVEIHNDGPVTLWLDTAELRG